MPLATTGSTYPQQPRATRLQGRIGNTLDGLGPLFDGQPALVDLSVVLSANVRSG